MQQERILTELLNSAKIYRFANMLDQVYDLDIAGFRKALILPLARAFTEFWNSSYRSLEVTIPQELVTLRKCSSFGTAFFVGVDDTLAFDDGLLAPLITKVWGQPLSVEEAPAGVYLLGERGRGRARMVVAIPGRYATILDILGAKKDALIQNRLTIDVTNIKGVVRLPRATKGLLEVNDEPFNVLNSPANFGPVTKYVTQMAGVVIAPERMLSFEHAMEGDSLNTLTDRLLGTLKDER